MDFAVAKLYKFAERETLKSHYSSGSMCSI